MCSEIRELKIAEEMTQFEAFARCQEAPKLSVVMRAQRNACANCCVNGHLGCAVFAGR